MKNGQKIVIEICSVTLLPCTILSLSPSLLSLSLVNAARDPAALCRRVGHCRQVLVNQVLMYKSLGDPLVVLWSLPRPPNLTLLRAARHPHAHHLVHVVYLLAVGSLQCWWWLCRAVWSKSFDRVRVDDRVGG